MIIDETELKICNKFYQKKQQQNESVFFSVVNKYDKDF